ncbi:hypothetical protein ACFQ5D_10900 [Paenibacillus farraposensis]|uniref:Phage protein n=1 Tax=Paenibacillus farraposensis TaxID=2807095 RepID=A0ABW4DFI3_9BACL|nr:hypothetical protein [Paenibacillus farraposensis]MCC3380730.1 hypothetical protein [Paenibacillus farraposensis]
MELEPYFKDIDRLKELASELSEDNPAALLKKIELLTQCHELIGEVSGECDRQYKLIHVQRDMEYAKAYINASRPKKERAELDTIEIRMIEAEAYGMSMKYRNEFLSLRETIHALKLKMKVNFADGSVRGRYG